MRLRLSVLLVLSFFWTLVHFSLPATAEEPSKADIIKRIADPFNQEKAVKPPAAASNGSDANAPVAGAAITNPADAKPAGNEAPAPGRDAPPWNRGGDLNAVPVIEKMKQGLLRIGNIIINKDQGIVSVKGEVNMREGLVEYLACGSRGKLHESILKVDVEPYYLQIALLLLGLEPGDKPLAKQGDEGIPDGAPVEIWITWSGEDKKPVQHRAEELVLNQSTNASMPKTDWVFTGSQVVKGRFMAQVEHSIAAVYHDPYAILDHSLSIGSDDRIFFANTSVLPPKGTPITMVIKTKKKPEVLDQKSKKGAGAAAKPGSNKTVNPGG